MNGDWTGSYLKVVWLIASNHISTVWCCVVQTICWYWNYRTLRITSRASPRTRRWDIRRHLAWRLSLQTTHHQTTLTTWYLLLEWLLLVCLSVCLSVSMSHQFVFSLHVICSVPLQCGYVSHRFVCLLVGLLPPPGGIMITWVCWCVSLFVTFVVISWKLQVVFSWNLTSIFIQHLCQISLLTFERLSSNLK